LKWAKDLAKDFSKVLHMFTQFMNLKYKLPDLQGGVEVCGIDIVAKALITSLPY